MCYKFRLVKDLDRLNRDLARVIVIDKEEEDLPYHKDNCIFVKPFTNPEEKDEELKMLIPFLQQMAMAPPSSVPDYRPVLKMYGNRDVGAKFKKRLDMLEAERKQRKNRSIFNRGRAVPNAIATQKQVLQQQQQQTPPAPTNTTVNGDTPTTTTAVTDTAVSEEGTSKKKGGIWSWLGISK
jgi:hypothetical protein